MTLAPRTRLGPYEIGQLLGQGGMGEVYRATDTRLARTVAIKILPEHLAGDPQRRERFEREARAVSSLNHPHICTLHDIGDQDGLHYLVMEYVEGETLAARLERGRLPLDQALAYAVQVADALDKAHRNGVVHRDLKPGTIMVTKAGVKLLDFGLAKLKVEAGAIPVLSRVPTIVPSAPLTAEGTILGTLQYMAPEQLESRDADGRTDIFAFGAVVYELVTGRKAFGGTSQASVIAAIMHADPQPMGELQTMTPPALDRIVRQCLAKDPDERWQSAGDLMRELKWIVSGDGTRAAPAAATATPPPMRTVRWIALSGVLAAAVSAVGTWMLKPAEPRLVTRLAANLGSPLPQFASIALSPDGHRLVYPADGRLYLRAMDEVEGVPILGNYGASIFPMSSLAASGCSSRRW